MSGWVPCDASWWPAMAEALPKPWPEAAAAMDLRWHEDQGAIPGRPTLRDRWGWTDWSVRSLLRDEARWVDPLRRQRSASGPPALRQRPASAPPAATRENLVNHDETASAPPAPRQPAASAPPAALHTRVVDTLHPHPAPSPHTDTEAAPPLPGLPSPGEGEVEPPALDEPADPSDAALPAWARRERRPKGVTAADLARAVTDVVAEIRGAPGLPAATAASTVLALWRRLERPPPAAFATMACLVARAVHDCPDPLFARDLRAEGWAEGRDRSRDVASVLRHDRWQARLDAAQAWDRAGRPAFVRRPQVGDSGIRDEDRPPTSWTVHRGQDGWTLLMDGDPFVGGVDLPAGGIVDLLDQLEGAAAGTVSAADRAEITRALQVGRHTQRRSA